MPQEILTPALKYHEALYHPNDCGNLLLRFREQGYCVLRNVYQPDTVGPFLDQMRSFFPKGEAALRTSNMTCDDPIRLYPGMAPRILQVLRGAFMPWIAEPAPVMLSAGWLLTPSNPDPHFVLDWHKDADHAGQSCVAGYSHPQLVHTAIYFEDMTPEMGPTYVVPRSHRERDLSPFNGAEEEPFLPSMGDVVLWDQRLWHRASPRTEPGTRSLVIYTYCSVPVIGKQYPLTPARQAALQRATSHEEKLLLGGPFEFA